MSHRIVSVTEVPNRTGGGNPTEAKDIVTLMFEMDKRGWDFWQDIYPDRRCPKVFEFNRAGNLFVIDINFDQEKDAPQVCTAKFTFSDKFDNSGGEGKPDSGGGGGFQYIANPLDRPAVISNGSYKSRKAWQTDVDGLPFCTTAGEPIPYEEEIEYPVIHIVKNVPSVSPIFATKRNFMNSDTVRILGYPYLPKTLALADLEVTQAQSEKGYVFCVLQFNLYYNPDTWEVKLRNAGYTQMYPVPTQMQVGNQIRTVNVMRPVAIKVGNPPQAPSHPMPLINDETKRDVSNFPYTHGSMFPDFYTVDPLTGVLAVKEQQSISPARLKEIWEKAQIFRNTKTAIRFANNLPLS